MEKAKPWGPLQPPKLNLWQSSTPGKPSTCQVAFLSCRSFCRDPCTCKHFPYAVAWEVQLREGSWASSLPGGLAGLWQAGAIGELLLYSWTGTYSGTCQPGIMVVQSHGTCAERHFMQGLPFCNMVILKVTAQFWVFCSSTKYHTAEH